MRDRDTHAAQETDEAQAGPLFPTVCPRHALCCSPQFTLGPVYDPGVATGSDPAALQWQACGRRFNHSDPLGSLRGPTDAFITSRQGTAPDGNSPVRVWPVAINSAGASSVPVDRLSGLAPRYHLSSLIPGCGIPDNSYGTGGFSNTANGLLGVSPVSDAVERYLDPRITGGLPDTLRLASESGFYGPINAPLDLSQGNNIYEGYLDARPSGGGLPGLTSADGGFSEAARPLPEIIRNGPNMRRRGLVFSCNGYPLSEALYPTPQYESLRQQLSSTKTFAGLDSEKISVFSTQPLRAFKSYQVRIRTQKDRASHDLHQVVSKITRHLEERGATISELSDWYLTDIVKTPNRKVVFECHFRVPKVGRR